MSDLIGDMIDRVEALNNNTPDGFIHDADTILADVFSNSDFEITGLANDIFNIYRNSMDKGAVVEMFYALTGIQFDTYLTICLDNITR